MRSDRLFVWKVLITMRPSGFLRWEASVREASR